MALRVDQMRENEELFRMANERLREQVQGGVAGQRVVPFPVRVCGRTVHGANRDDA